VVAIAPVLVDHGKTEESDTHVAEDALSDLVLLSSESKCSLFAGDRRMCHWLCAHDVLRCRRN